MSPSQATAAPIELVEFEAPRHHCLYPARYVPIPSAWSGCSISPVTGDLVRVEVAVRRPAGRVDHAKARTPMLPQKPTESLTTVGADSEAADDGFEFAHLPLE